MTVTVLSAVGYLAADLLSSPRMVYALGESAQLPRAFATVHSRFGTPVIAIAGYSLLCFAVAASGSFRQLVIIGSSGTLMLYLICCLGLLRLRAGNVAMAGTPYRAPGGLYVPLAASIIMIWMLSTLTWRELFAASCMVVVAGIGYGIHQRMLCGDVGSGKR